MLTPLHRRLFYSAQLGVSQPKGIPNDDNPATIRSRLKTYHAQNEPLADYYQQHGVFVKVEGEGTPAEVSRKVIAAAKSFVPA